MHRLCNSRMHVASRRKPIPQFVFWPGTLLSRCRGRLLNRNCCGEHTSQPSVVDAREILPQGCIRSLVSPQNGCAELRARLAKETELSFLVATPAKPVDFRGNGEYAQPVGMVQRYCKAQDCEVPRPYHPGVPFIRLIAQFHVGRHAHRVCRSTNS